jgi:hypothetical protein
MGGREFDSYLAGDRPDPSPGSIPALKNQE